MILAQREQLTLARSEVTVGRLEIERLQLMLAKARREQFGQSSERGKLLVEQLELAIEDLEESLSQPYLPGSLSRLFRSAHHHGF